MLYFPLCNERFDQAPNLAHWNIKGWSGVGSGDAYNGSALNKLFAVWLVSKWQDWPKSSGHHNKEYADLKRN